MCHEGVLDPHSVSVEETVLEGAFVPLTVGKFKFTLAVRHACIPAASVLRAIRVDTLPVPLCMSSNKLSHVAAPACFFKDTLSMATTHAELALVPIAVWLELNAVPMWDSPHKFPINSFARRL